MVDRIFQEGAKYFIIFWTGGPNITGVQIFRYRAFQIKHLYICHPECYHLTTLDTANMAHYFSATRDDKINDCGFKFSVACEWRILIEEDKNTIHQSFSRQILEVTNLPKFYPTTVVCYTVATSCVSP